MRSGGGNERAETNENKGPRRHPLPLDVRVRAQPEGPPSTRPHGREKNGRACTDASLVATAPPPGCAATKQRRAAIAAGAVCLARCERASRAAPGFRHPDLSSASGLFNIRLCQLFLGSRSRQALADSDGRTSRKRLAKAAGCLEMHTTSFRLNFKPIVGGLSPSRTRERRRSAPRHARAMETSHTIVLIQYNLQSSSRTYLDYEGLHRALDGAHLLPAAAARGLNLNR